MNLYTTRIKAIDPKTGVLEEYIGPRIEAISITDAEAYCHENGLGYCEVVGMLVAEVSLTGEITDYEPINPN